MHISLGISMGIRPISTHPIMSYGGEVIWRGNSQRTAGAKGRRRWPIIVSMHIILHNCGVISSMARTISGLRPTRDGKGLRGRGRRERSPMLRRGKMPITHRPQMTFSRRWMQDSGETHVWRAA